MSKLPNNDPRAKFKAVEKSLKNDIDVLSDTELTKELGDDGLSISDIARSMRFSAMKILIEARKETLSQNRADLERSFQTKNSIAISRARPNVDVIKQVLEELFSTKPALAVAFRQGKSQSDTDWISLWDDLVEMGEISEDGRAS